MTPVLRAGIKYPNVMFNMARDYAKEYRDYHGKPAQRKRRSCRNKSNKIMKPGKGKDVHHKDHNPCNMKRSNMQVISRSRNRSMNKKR